MGRPVVVRNIESRRTGVVRTASSRPSARRTPEISEEQLELVEVTYSGIDVELYTSIRGIGISHSDTMEAHALGADLEAYGFLRLGYDHTEAVVEAGATGTALHQDAVQLGVTADELSELRASYRASVTTYWREIATDGAALNYLVRPKPPMTSDYLVARRVGLSHGASLDFACRLAVLSGHREVARMPQQEVELWARCRIAGLKSNMVAVVRPVLNAEQLSVLHATLFVLVSYDELEKFSQRELLWLAAKSRSRNLDANNYVEARRRHVPRRIALFRATSRRRSR